MEHILPYWPVILFAISAVTWLARLEFSVAHIKEERAKDEARREKQRAEDEARWKETLSAMEARHDKARSEDRANLADKTREIKDSLDEHAKHINVAIEARHVDNRERIATMERNLIDRIQVTAAMARVEQILKEGVKT